MWHAGTTWLCLAIIAQSGTWDTKLHTYWYITCIIVVEQAKHLKLVLKKLMLIRSGKQYT